MKSRPACIGLALVTILAGLLLRLGPWRPPLAVHHYGGGVLWGMMLLAGVAACRPRGTGLPACLAVAGAAAAAIESVRLIRFPELDAFRHTLPGQLFLGQLFSAWNLLAYAVGIGIMAAMVRPVVNCRTREAADPESVA